MGRIFLTLNVIDLLLSVYSNENKRMSEDREKLFNYFTYSLDIMQIPLGHIILISGQKRWLGHGKRREKACCAKQERAYVINTKLDNRKMWELYMGI